VGNLIIDTTLEHWQRGRKTRRANGGWLSGNAVCCTHRGETPDKRGRGGIIVDGNKISFNCFNCHFSCGYTIGGPLGVKFQKLLEWLGVDHNMMVLLRFEAMKSANDAAEAAEQIAKTVEPLIEIPLPDESVLLADVIKDFPEHADYLTSRGFAVSDYPFFVTHNQQLRMHRRVILPFMRDGLIIGNTARAINDMIRPKYLRTLKSPYVFGIDTQRPNWEWTIVVEGEFDALAVAGLGIGGNEISDDQAELIEKTGKRPIVVGDSDAGGLLLIQEAADRGWAVSFPEWGCDRAGRPIKDLNAAVLEYGRLAVTKHIIDMATANPVTISIKKKLLSRAK